MHVADSNSWPPHPDRGNNLAAGPREPAPKFSTPGAGEPDGSRQWICQTAMKCFAEHGTEAASLRMIAHAAGVSVGLVQHRFITKAALIAAVDEELVIILRRAALTATPPVDPATDLARWLTEVAAKHPEALDYLLQLLITDSPTGRAIFNQLAGVGAAHWDRRHDGADSSADSTWAALHPLLLTFGALLLRPHVERHLPQPVDIAGQLAAIGNLLRPRRAARAAHNDVSQ